ncbi:hypothetical protein Shyd_51500 [Streptomyces hydrogenans]|uniref:Uncharacterized protein n=1 Tax=Streptomyces hydrogenans TaxID=1873719 RepID=A0ABQ3PFH7_9ACTN|nr:hypothetical protein GCM10018784_33070 [Streptomyces hydrogenans]GHI23779.1 hypothetical protein Shyd_51500 [Streptomyces hydrogenans]
MSTLPACRSPLSGAADGARGPTAARSRVLILWHCPAGETLARPYGTRTRDAFRLRQTEAAESLSNGLGDTNDGGA